MFLLPQFLGGQFYQILHLQKDIMMINKKSTTYFRLWISCFMFNIKRDMTQLHRYRSELRTSSNLLNKKYKQLRCYIFYCRKSVNRYRYL